MTASSLDRPQVGEMALPAAPSRGISVEFFSSAAERRFAFACQNSDGSSMHVRRPRH